jgi:hypothetical protein
MNANQVAAAQEEGEDGDDIEEYGEVLAESLQRRAEERDDGQEADEHRNAEGDFSPHCFTLMT